MADYWKSQAKKFCDFCKCWITDNKPSVEFHERGKRHKENVAKKLKDITKRSKKEFKSQLKIKDEIEKMQEAGMKAYMRDVEANADYSSGIIRKEIGLPEIPESSLSNDTKEWHEAKKGNETYYWNSTTGESTYEKPKEFTSIQEQNDSLKMYHVKKLAEESESLKKQNEEAKEERRARELREKMKRKKVDTTEQPKYFGPLLPDTKDSPYGQWLAVDLTEKNKLDLQLPPQAPKVEVIKIKKPKFVLTEKVIRQLKTEEDDSTVTDTTQFKKRKLNCNIRKRCDPD